MFGALKRGSAGRGTGSHRRSPRPPASALLSRLRGDASYLDHNGKCQTRSESGTHLEDAPPRGHPSSLARVCIRIDFLTLFGIIRFFIAQIRAVFGRERSRRVLFVFSTVIHTHTHTVSLKVALQTVLLSLWPLQSFSLSLSLTHQCLRATPEYLNPPFCLRQTVTGGLASVFGD